MVENNRVGMWLPPVYNKSGRHSILQKAIHFYFTSVRMVFIVNTGGHVQKDDIVMTEWTSKFRWENLYSIEVVSRKYFISIVCFQFIHGII